MPIESMVMVSTLMISIPLPGDVGLMFVMFAVSGIILI